MLFKVPSLKGTGQDNLGKYASAIYLQVSTITFQGIGCGWAGVIWLYNIVTYIPLDFIKFLTRYALSGRAWDQFGLAVTLILHYYISVAAWVVAVTLEAVVLDHIIKRWDDALNAYTVIVSQVNDGRLRIVESPSPSLRTCARLAQLHVTL
ncbi:hypothetical protein MKW98_023317 [Papaver atlanticum]|uniref:Uncharacterized protein n=1 Tax=Papaver atlanticum TaxID=357466 RepID=A0AAD4TE13_9MAGN|nr:hypothetical protein MKW98_023317 [Papaver atlanticum]